LFWSIGIQIFGGDDVAKEATEITTLANPDLMDINYGCPVKQVACLVPAPVAAGYWW